MLLKLAIPHTGRGLRQRISLSQVVVTWKDRRKKVMTETRVFGDYVIPPRAPPETSRGDRLHCLDARETRVIMDI